MPICLIYAFLSPIILLIGVLYFSISYVTLIFRFVYMNCPKNEMNGLLWPHISKGFILSIILAQIFFTGQIFLNFKTTASFEILICLIQPVGMCILQFMITNRFKGLEVNNTFFEFFTFLTKISLILFLEIIFPN